MAHGKIYLVLSMVNKLLRWLRGETGTQDSAKVLRVGSTPTEASIIPDPIPKMTQGWVVEVFNINNTHCSFCNRKLFWKLLQKGGTEESWAVEQEKFKLDYKYWPMLAWGPPSTQWVYGCPKYGKDVPGPMGWHDYWWEDDLMSIFEEIKKDLTNAEA